MGPHPLNGVYGLSGVGPNVTDAVLGGAGLKTPARAIAATALPMIATTNMIHDTIRGPSAIYLILSMQV